MVNFSPKCGSYFFSVTYRRIHVLCSTILSNFSVVQRPDLVQLAFVEEVVTTTNVFQEMQMGVSIGKIPLCDWQWLPKVELTPIEQDTFYQLITHLGVGEASCLAIAGQRGYSFATDDQDARRQARRSGIPTTGTIGILAILVKRGQINYPNGR